LIYVLAFMMVGAKYTTNCEEGGRSCDGPPKYDYFKVPDGFIVFALFGSAIINGVSVGILWAAAN
jgi:hypothetical protein